MAITFPREMPLKITGDITFQLAHQQTRGLAGGGPQVAELGPSLWTGSWRITAGSDAEFNGWSAWLASLRGGLRLFKGRPRRRWPARYPTGLSNLTVGGDAFTGAGVVAQINAGRASAVFSGFPTGFILTTGDWFSVAVGDRQHLHQIVEGGVAAANSIVTVAFEPPLHQSAVGGASVQVDGPWCDMTLAPGASVVSQTKGGAVTFSGTQRLI